jgi:hypothetical protein
MLLHRNEASRRLGVPAEERASPSEPISPELVLVDPELARRVRRESQPIRRGPRPGDRRPRARSGVPPRILVPRPEGAAATARRVEPANVRRRRPQRPAPRPARLALAVLGAFLLGLALGHIRGSTEQRSSEPFEAQPSRDRAETGTPRQPARTEPAPAPQPGIGTAVRSPGAGRSAEGERPERARRRPAGPAPSEQDSASRVFVWLPVPGTSRYVVRLFRGGEKVYERSVKAPRIVLPQRWSHAGRRFELTRGAYVWSVHAVHRGPRSTLGSPIVHAKLVVQR